MKPTVEQLEAKINQLEAKLAVLEKAQIKIAGDFDGTDVQVTINGVRRSITTSAP